MRALLSIIIIVIIFAVLILITKSVKVSGGQETPTPSPTQTVQATQEPMNNSTPSASLKIEDVKVGTGVEAVPGKRVTVTYVGTLTDGTKFDSSFDHGQPFAFNLGAGEVIKGWDEGVAGMKVGGKRKLTIPPSLGYGSANIPGIPPNSTLLFDIELVRVE